MAKGHAVGVKGLKEFQAALKRADAVAAKELKRGLKDIAEITASKARGNVTHRTGRHGGSGIRLDRSIKTSATAKGATVYSNAPHSVVQDVGGQVGRNRATLLRRADASRYMTRAEEQTRGARERELEAVLDRIINDLAR